MKKLDIGQFKAAIMLGEFTNAELNTVIEAIKWSRAQLAKETKQQLRIGSMVSFDSTKLGRNVKGFVTKIAVKYVTVNTSHGQWRVPANMLQIEADEHELA
jgi:hypothetical protein